MMIDRIPEMTNCSERRDNGEVSVYVQVKLQCYYHGVYGKLLWKQS